MIELDFLNNGLRELKIGNSCSEKWFLEIYSDYEYNISSIKILYYKNMSL